MNRLLSIVSLLAIASACGPAGGRDSTVPEEAIRHNIRGTAHLGQTQWAEAEAEFRLALTTRPDDPLLLTNSAIAALQQEKTEQAVELLRRAVVIRPDYSPAHFNLGLIASREGEFERAVTHFQRVAELAPDDLFTQYYLGTSLARVERMAEAEAALRRALDLDPTHISTLYALGRLLLQQGREEEGMQRITRSQEIRARSGLDEAVGHQYGEQGLLSRAADYPGGTLQAPDPIELSFASLSSARLELADRARFAAYPLEGATALLTSQKNSVLQLFPGGRDEPWLVVPIEQAEILALEIGDVDNDGLLDVLLIVATTDTDGGGRLRPVWYRRDENGLFRTPPTSQRFDDGGTLEGSARALDAALVDRDHDGDLDLFWCFADAERTACTIATNDGRGAFTSRPAAEHGIPAGPSAEGLRVAFSDVDNDRDIDLWLATDSGIRLFSNERDGSFEERDVGLQDLVAPSSHFEIADLNKDGWMDLLVGGGGGLRLLLNRQGRFDGARTLAADSVDGEIAVADLDNDGFLDLIYVTDRGPRLLRNLGNDAFDGAVAIEIDSGDPLQPSGAAVDAADFDGDGDLDLAFRDDTGNVSVIGNDGGNAQRFISLRSSGVGDNRFGIGAKVEVLAGALRQKFELTRPLPLHVGLGMRERVDAARYVWPSGVVQDEIDLAGGAPIAIAQLDRKGTSCPLLYARSGGSWRFVTDFLGGAAIGYQFAPGRFSTPDTDEYVLIDVPLETDPDEPIELRLNNQLEEVIWFDKAQLIAVEHPVSTQIFPNERLMPGPPFPEFRIFAGSDVRPARAAYSHPGRIEVTRQLLRSDRLFVDGFETLAPKGYAAVHGLELDLGEFEHGRRVVLLLEGWIDYADSSANVAAAQAAIELVPPRLSVADGRGGWIEDRDRRMGFPAGLPKTMAVELSGLFPTSDHRIRIDSSMRIYWDRVQILIGGEQTELTVHRIDADSAELEFGGFPEAEPNTPIKPLGYDPERVGTDHTWKAHVGAYTGFGDVSELLAEIDDRFVTTRNGDQILLRFPRPPAPRDGFRYSYLLYADGFGKDMDPNSAAANDVGPIPFHGMPTYPYGEEVMPPVLQHELGPRPRLVTAATDGLPGALPLGRHVRLR